MSYFQIQEQIKQIENAARAATREVAESFDPKKDKIGFQIRRLIVVKNKDGLFDKINEVVMMPYFAASNKNGNDATIWHPDQLEPIPAKKGEDVVFENTFLYGPENPGEALHYAVSFFEVDDQGQKLAQSINNIVTNKEYRQAADEFSAAVGGAIVKAGVNLVNTLVALISNEIAQKDAFPLGSFHGSLFQDDENNGPYRLKDPGWVETTPYIHTKFRVQAFPGDEDTPTSPTKQPQIVKLSPLSRTAPKNWRVRASG